MQHIYIYFTYNLFRLTNFLHFYCKLCSALSWVDRQWHGCNLSRGGDQWGLKQCAQTEYNGLQSNTYISLLYHHFRLTNFLHFLLQTIQHDMGQWPSLYWLGMDTHNRQIITSRCTISITFSLAPYASHRPESNDTDIVERRGMAEYGWKTCNLLICTEQVGPLSHTVIFGWTIRLLLLHVLWLGQTGFGL